VTAGQGHVWRPPSTSLRYWLTAICGARRSVCGWMLVPAQNPARLSALEDGGEAKPSSIASAIRRCCPLSMSARHRD